MTEYVSKDDVRKIFAEEYGTEFEERIKRLEKDSPIVTIWPRHLIEKIPTADVAPIIHAHWIKMIEISDVYDIYYVCSNCNEELERVALQNPTIYYPYGKYKSIEPTKYCPHCGAIMDEKQNDESPKDGCLYLINKDGCRWHDGVGESPKGHFCGKCDCIDKENCYVRERERREATVYDKETCSVRELEKKEDEKNELET